MPPPLIGIERQLLGKINLYPTSPRAFENSLVPSRMSPFLFFVFQFISFNVRARARARAPSHACLSTHACPQPRSPSLYPQPPPALTEPQESNQIKSNLTTALGRTRKQLAERA